MDCGSGASLSNFIYVFILGQILHGVGGTACFTICPAYIDEHVESVKTPLFVGKCSHDFIEDAAGLMIDRLTVSY